MKHGVSTYYSLSWLVECLCLEVERGCWVPHRFLTAVLQWLMKQTAMMYQSSVRMQSRVKIQWEHHWLKKQRRKKCCACLFPSIITNCTLVKVWPPPPFFFECLQFFLSLFHVTGKWCASTFPAKSPNISVSDQTHISLPSHRQTWDQAEGSDLLPGYRRGLLRSPAQCHKGML